MPDAETPAENVPESGLVVVVDEARPLVDGVRAEFDAGAALGVPPHVTVLYPFLPPEQIDATVLDRLTALLAGDAGFDTVFRGLGWFDDRVLWLAPEPADAFRDLTGRLVEAYPECPPYGGRHDTVVPHLTVGALGDQPEPDRRERLEAAAATLTAGLPLHARVREVALLVQDAPGGSFRRRATFPLGPAGG
ncbi:2'-5' RNA ligase [Friedmanniella endophytica]|uniref:2'-5' RNA ligase n=1 Tax=Microlunatus kandeliicorticis TaxID=1759536 RepID=A0A7W3IP22_9ACTN|nr:2'-5' RNA ligase family protein [Microlunatus kandeliicorticis]MBA8792619.1 2'-5' RNA ligase [Microlunatus kandeliicorticis]